MAVPLASADALYQSFDVCVVGAGPAGLSCAFACHDRGLRVLLLDAGQKQPVPGSPDILAAEIADTGAHDPVEIIAASALGGSSHWWGGRSVPLDPVDFENWPVAWDEMLPWWRYAAELIGAGAVLERPAPGNFAALDRFRATTAESWVPTPLLSDRWRGRIRSKEGPAIVLGARVTGLTCKDGRIAAVQVQTPGGPRLASARHFVLTSGGLGGLRLMLMAQRTDPTLFGGPGGPLGRGYMGHLTGSIADIVPSNRADASEFFFFEANGGYVARRRIVPQAQTVLNEAIGNIAFWLDNPPSAVAAHGSAEASARFLAACGVRVMAGKWKGLPELAPHFANVGRAPWAAAASLGHTAWRLGASRFTRQRYLPRRFLSSGDGGWRMVYHAEQRHDPANRISLVNEPDSIGLPKLRIDFRYAERDVDSVVKAHTLLDQDLQAAGAGRLRWREGEGARAAVAASARDGYHQLGGAIMSTSASSGVVDRNCLAWGLDNLWVASGSVFPSGGQANPTLTIIALACRTADQIASLSRSGVRRAIPIAATRQAGRRSARRPAAV